MSVICNFQLFSSDHIVLDRDIENIIDLSAILRVNVKYNKRTYCTNLRDAWSKYHPYTDIGVSIAKETLYWIWKMKTDYENYEEIWIFCQGKSYV